MVDNYIRVLNCDPIDNGGPDYSRGAVSVECQQSLPKTCNRFPVTERGRRPPAYVVEMIRSRRERCVFSGQAPNLPGIARKYGELDEVFDAGANEESSAYARENASCACAKASWTPIERPL